MNYEERYSSDTNELLCIFEPTIGFIPADESNADYQAYLAWLAEQPTPKAGK